MVFSISGHYYTWTTSAYEWNKWSPISVILELTTKLEPWLPDSYISDIDGGDFVKGETVHGTLHKAIPIYPPTPAPAPPVPAPEPVPSPPPPPPPPPPP